MKELVIKEFGKLADGTEVSQYILENDFGDQVVVTPFGATLVAWYVNENEADSSDAADTTPTNLVLGFDDVSKYEADKKWNFGATVGPYANRIAGAEFRLNENFYKLNKNDGNNNLHSGDLNFGKKLWDVVRAEDHAVTFAIKLDDETYPGNLLLKVTYSYGNDRQLGLHYEAESDEDTYINPTNHSYFNLNGSGSVDNLHLEVNSRLYTPVNEDLIPSGEVLSVEGTGFDLRTLTKMEDVFASKDEDIVAKAGLDHNFVLDKEIPNEYFYAARIVNMDTQKQLVCFTQMPALQIFTGNGLDGVEGSDGRVYHEHDGICLETQYFPDAVNNAHFPSPLLRAGETFSSETLYTYVDYVDFGSGEDEDIF